jgi:hypothetical protein
MGCKRNTMLKLPPSSFDDIMKKDSDGGEE